MPEGEVWRMIEGRTRFASVLLRAALAVGRHGWMRDGLHHYDERVAGLRTTVFKDAAPTFLPRAAHFLRAGVAMCLTSGK
jgi:hypothetical protein